METTSAAYTGPRLFGAPVGDFTFFQSLLFVFAATVASFLGATFLGIIGVSIWSIFSHHFADFSISYKWVGLPVGVLMFVSSATYLGTLLARRMVRTARNG